MLTRLLAYVRLEVMKWSMTYFGTIPSKKNGRILAKVRGRMINIPSKRYKEWHKDITSQLKETVKFEPNENEALKITCQFWYQTKRRGDLDNKLASILDWLTDQHIIPDDDAKILQEVHLYYMGVDRTDPHTDIEIETIEKPRFS